MDHHLHRTRRLAGRRRRPQDAPHRSTFDFSGKDVRVAQKLRHRCARRTHVHVRRPPALLDLAVDHYHDAFGDAQRFRLNLDIGSVFAARPRLPAGQLLCLELLVGGAAVENLRDPQKVRVMCDGSEFSNWWTLPTGEIQVVTDVGVHAFEIVTGG